MLNRIDILKTILIIEDERVIAEILSAVLEDEGYNVQVADNGKEGIATLKSTHPDLVLCDLMMPIADGKAVARAMAADPSTRSIPLIIMSAGGNPPTDPTPCSLARFGLPARGGQWSTVQLECIGAPRSSGR